MSCKKRRFADWAAAASALSRITDDPKTVKIPCRAYQCRACHGWHLTSQVTHK